MKSSDQRYFQVRRPKSQTNHYVELAKALRDARQDPLKVIEVDKLVAASTTDFTHVMLVCGRTAKDFRRNFRRGCAEFNTVTAVQLVPYETLLKAELDGYSLLRLTKEQRWNVKQRWAKLREQDALLHDPQGAFWTRVLRALLDGRHDGHLSILTDIRDKGQRPVAETVTVGAIEETLSVLESEGAIGLLADEEKHGPIIERILKDQEREVRSLANEVTEELPKFTPTNLWNIALGELKHAQGLNRAMLEPDNAAIKPALRIEVEKSLVVAEAYVDGGDVRAALFNPDTSDRHCSDARLQERINRAVLRMVEIEQQST